jgi:ATP-dependent protease ClpP protease subunit
VQVTGTFRDFVMRQPPKGAKDWFRIENKNDDGPAKIYIYDEIGFWGTDAAGFIRELSSVTNDQIELHINSPGGAIFDGVAIYNALKAHPAEIIVHVDALAASAASFIAQAGDKILMTRNATMMIHDGSGGCWGTAQDMFKMGDLLDKLSNTVADMYAQRAGGTQEEWRAFMKEEVWYNAEEAVEAKLADEVLDYDDKEAEQAQNRWNLSIFNHAGRADAPSPEEIRKKLASVTNRAKEAPVGRTATPPKMTEPGGAPPAEGTETQPDQPSPEQTPPGNEPTPDAGTSGDGAPVPGSEPAPAGGEGGESETGGEQQTGGEGGDGTPTGLLNHAGHVVFTVNGMQTSDPKAVQKHINVLEQAAFENKMMGRKGFVARLVQDRKVSAAQQNELEEFVVDLTDEQWKKWTASYEKAPALSLLENHGKVGESSGVVNGLMETQDRIEVLEAIIEQHKKGGMPKAQIERTPTYLELQQLKSASTASS